MGGSHSIFERRGGDGYVSKSYRDMQRAQRRAAAGLAQVPNLRNRSARKAKRAAQKRARY